MPESLDMNDAVPAAPPAEGAEPSIESDETYALPTVSYEDEEPTGELPDDRYLDRELSWLAFNQRVLEMAEDPQTPLLERARFLAIFASNLDEFFMVRVAGLKRRIAAGFAVPSATGMSATRQIEAIIERAHEIMDRHAEVFQDQVRPALANEGITLVRYDSLGEAEQERLRKLFRSDIFPVLTPLAVDPAHPFPYISGLSLNLAVEIRDPDTGKDFFARVKVPETLPRFLSVDAAGKVGQVTDAASLSDEPRSFVPLEDVIGAHLDYLFPGMEVVDHYTFRVTRNEDVEVEEDDAENLLKAMEKELLRRRFGPAVRVEVADDLPAKIRELLVRELGITENDVFHLPAPLDLTGLNAIADLDRPSLQFASFRPTTHHKLAPVETAAEQNVFEAITRGDVLLHHPYDSFSTSVQAFLAQAAMDPKVLAIKQTLYRTSGDSPIVDALIEAAHNGKQVLALVEIKARFDEQRNISWARKLEQAGVHVVYGLVGLKTHCKLSLVVRQEEDGLHRYCHIGTGNYHPRTARLYEDYGLLTKDSDTGADLTKLFNQLSGYAPKAKFRRLIVAPTGVRVGLIERIENEARNARAGKDAWVKIKVNSAVDEKVIDALYRASQAGVKVDINVRGICAVRPGVPGFSENVRVRSILGRFLEHSRIYAFANDGDPEVFIGSADLMHRNLDRRIEALITVTDEQQKANLIENVDLAMSAKVAGWELHEDGSWARTVTDGHGERLKDLQEIYIKRQPKRRAKGK
ncbi:RNA degradosome polyphosphate kinase [Demequina lignilytica]|uniref:Polyphosphate kinase n=1 Tax=Demequina lignilytica TaxID=3051663 RepID=A0AAW7M4A1_9MICO|nr:MULTISPECIES: RNA degradosome polyphosphate kinase [unclassified Demequina]MDN4478614.1 RNA degradosome polyphosphate kinase [Demequina sp. SYSU T00039-1]MDN4483826.1 RNA degradosome polyphosphate kinase [Demequina sp. SYSU T0a273]MDN4488592.1 RNA degradosome polyphosphate kinase [Demequina sp. SYSU T00039]